MGYRLLLQGFLTGLFFLAVSGCGILQPDTGAGSKEALRARVADLMEAKMAADWGKVYNFYDPEYKEKISKDKFLGLNRSLTFLDYTIKEIEVEPSGDAATVNVEVGFSSYGFDFNALEIQHWIRKEGTWYQKIEIKKTPGMP